MIIPYLRDMINNHKNPMNLKVHSRAGAINYKTQFGEWKIQLTAGINFISSRDFNETRIMHTKSDNIEIMMASETNDIIIELIDSLLQKYQEGLRVMRGSEFIPNSVDLLYYHLQNRSLKNSGSYIKSFEWLENKKTTINPKNDDDNFLQYSTTAVLNNQKIGNNPQRI